MNRLSIIVPVYNDEKNINNCINSLLKQTEQVDIIVVDDGSIDSTAESVLKLAEANNNIHYYKKVNEGVAEARNFGIDKVKTEYFGFLDSDDTCESDMCKKMLNRIVETESDICFSDFTWVYPTGKRRISKDTDYSNKKELLTKMYATLWNKIYKTSWFKGCNVLFPKGLQYEDASVLYRLVPFMDKVCYVNNSLVNYYQREGSITHTFNINVNHMIKVFSGIIDEYKKKNLFNEYKDELEYITTRFFLGNSYLRTCRIEDKKIRNEILNKSWEFLSNNFPFFSKNKYLNNSGIKNSYYKTITEKSFYRNVKYIKLLYKIGLLK